MTILRNNILLRYLDLKEANYKATYQTAHAGLRRSSIATIQFVSREYSKYIVRYTHVHRIFKKQKTRKIKLNISFSNKLEKTSEQQNKKSSYLRIL